MTTLEKLMLKMAAAGGNIAEYEATGNPLTFETNVAKNLKSLLIPWTPTQSGSGDPSPSNVRPISGITGLNVYHPGNNIVPPDAEYEENYFINSSGEVESNNSYKYSPDYIPVEPNTTYYVSMNKTISTALGFTVPLYDSSKGFIERIVAIGSSGSSGKGTYTGSFTTTSATAFIRISVPKSSDTIEVRNQKNYAVVFPALGKNLLDITKTSKIVPGASGSTITIENGVISIDAVANSARSYVVFSQTFPAGTYTIQAQNSGAVSMPRMLCSKEFSGSSLNTYYGMYMKQLTANELTFTVSESCVIGLVLSNSAGEAGSPGTLYDIQLETGETASTFEPFTNTVYGGSLDLVSGVLTAEWAGFAKTWADGESATDMGSGITRKEYPMVDNLQTGTAKNMCNIAPYSANENADVHFYYSGSGSTNRKCRLFLPTETDGSTPVVVITNISVPLTWQLTPQQIQTLIGDNVIWTDTNGSNTATYLKKG